MKKTTQIAARVIAKADREHPADLVLRTELKNTKGIVRSEGGLVSEAVFAYYRWLNWLNPNAIVEEQIDEAVLRNRDFQKKSDGLSAPELQRAIPSWVNGAVKVSPEWLQVLQLKPGIWLRARPGTAKGLAERLGECWVGGEGFPADAVRYDGAEDLFRTAEFYAGEFELQDLSSQVVGLACNPQPGETWWDACAGEGGKMLHLCDLMRNKGLVWASDRAEWRLQKLKRRAARAKIFNYRAVLWDGGAKLPTKTKFDGILVDAPCSGLGTWQRNPQARWTTTLRDVTELSAIQQDLVTRAAAALKPGGRLIYSVCTLTEAETNVVADAVTQRLPELKPLSFLNPLNADAAATERLWLWPQDAGGNGMFICGWQKSAAKAGV
jgi:16S rRNA (cytosine967-C5)-methyltransferase